MCILYFFSGLVHKEVPCDISVPRIACHRLLGGLCRWPGILVPPEGVMLPTLQRQSKTEFCRMSFYCGVNIEMTWYAELAICPARR